MKKIISFIILLLLIPIIPFPISAEKTEFDNNCYDLPPYFSWQDINGTDYTTPIKDQSPAPTCEAYGLCGALETIMQYQMQEVYNPDLSEMHLYFYAGGSYEQGYVNLIDAANYLIEYGVPDEGCYPDPHRAFDYPFESVPGWEERTVKIQAWGWVDHDIDSIKNALIEYGPLVVCMYLYRDFFYYRGGVYEHKWGKIAGGHVMTLVGYDDIHECWIIKNSWGTGWGENGWLRISYYEDVLAEWYGAGTGVMYIDGVYGNLNPDVPKVQLEKPTFFHTYLFNHEFSTILKKLPVQKAAARIFRGIEVKVTSENTERVEFLIDNEVKYVDIEEPFSWELQSTKGLHTLEIRAIKGENVSLAIVDFYKFI